MSSKTEAATKEDPLISMLISILEEDSRPHWKSLLPRPLLAPRTNIWPPSGQQTPLHSAGFIRELPLIKRKTFSPLSSNQP